MFEKIDQVRTELQDYSQENLAQKLPLLDTCSSCTITQKPKWISSGQNS